MRLAVTSNLDWGSYIVSVAKTAYKKIWALIHTMKFLSFDVPLYLYCFNIELCMEYCYRVWLNSAHSYLDMLDKLQKWGVAPVGLEPTTT